MRGDLIMIAAVYTPGQLPLIEIVESDDSCLQHETNVLWVNRQLERQLETKANCQRIAMDA